MKSGGGILWIVLLGFCLGHVSSISRSITFSSVETDSKFDGLIAPTGYIERSSTTESDRAQCGAKCVLMAECRSFFLDISTSVCQFHSTVLGDSEIADLVPLPSSLYYILASECPDGWYSFQYWCYLIDVQNLLTFDSAKEFCTQNGGYVLRVESSEENDYLKTIFPILNSTENFFWVGLTDLANKDTWVWDETGLVPTYTDWGVSQPQYNEERCTSYHGGSSYTWHDVPCNIHVHAVCKK